MSRYLPVGLVDQ